MNGHRVGLYALVWMALRARHSGRFWALGTRALSGSATPTSLGADPPVGRDRRPAGAETSAPSVFTRTDEFHRFLSTPSTTMQATR
jgi:hypothetical protein